MLNDLNDLILNMKKKEEFGELEDFSGMGSVDNDDIFNHDTSIHSHIFNLFMMPLLKGHSAKCQ